MNWLERTQLLIGAEALESLKDKHILVVGLGGVGASAAEQICRAGVGEMTIVDGDTISITNRNRQLPALVSTTGKPKAKTIGDRLLDINPDLKLHIIQEYIRDDRMIEIYHTIQKGHKLVSSMGSGGKLDPAKVQIADFSKSRICPLARVLRKRLGRLGVREGFQVVFSTEEVPDHAMIPCEDEPNKKTTIGTISYMPPLFGCLMASVVIRGLIES
jgi:tRNA A37 threonylcarbamoyladenosine dehydratase